MTASRRSAPGGRTRPLALAALLLAGLAAVAMQPAQGQPNLPGPDLAVTSLGIDGVPAWTYGQGGSTEVRLRVANQGSVAAAYRIDYSWVPEGGTAMPLNGEAQASFDVGDPLAPGSDRPHHAQWTLVPGVAGPGRIVATITADAGERDPADNEGVLQVFVPVRLLQVADLSQTQVDLPPDATRFVRLRVDNPGNAAASVRIGLGGLEPPEPRLQASVEPAVLAVPAGGHANATIYLRFDAAGDLAPFETVATLTADPGFGAPLETTTGALRDAPSTGSNGYDFALGPAALPTVHVPEVGWTQAVLRVHNLGAQADDYSLGVTVPAGWQSAFDPARLALDAGQSADVVLRLRAGGDLPGTPADLGVWAMSGAVGSQRALEVPVRRSGPGLAEPEVRLPPLYRGDRPTIEVDLRNDGDVTATSTRLRLRVGTSVGSLQDLPPIDVGQVGPGRLTTLRPVLPLLTAGGPLVVEADWVASPGSHQPPARLSEAFVRVANARVDAPAPASGVPGQGVSYRAPPATFTVTNLGTSDEEFEVAATTPVGSASVDGPTRLALAPGERRAVAVVHTLPSSTGASAVANLTLEARLVARPLSWRATVATGIVDGRPPTLAIDGPTAAAIGSVQRVLLSAEDDTWIRNVTIEVMSPAGNVSGLPVVPAGNGTWEVTWQPSADGRHTLRAMARDSAGNAAIARLDVLVQAAAPPRLALATTDAQVHPAAVLSFTVEDAFPLSSATATLLQDGLVRPQPVTVEGGRVLVTLDAREGPARVTVAVRNALGATANLTVDLDVSADAPLAPAEGPAPPRDASAGAPFVALAALALALACRRLA